MTRDRQQIEGRFRAITFGIIAVIVYGSLYPFCFYNNPDPDGPLRALLHTWRILGGRGDSIANFILYVPLGFFLVRDKRPRSYSFFVAVAGGISLSTVMELLQFYDATRYSQMSDIYLNGAGTICGAAAGILCRRIDFRLGGVRRHDFVALLLVCWLGYRLFPYAPVIDLHKYWAAIKPVVLSPRASSIDVYRHTVTWLGISMLLEAIIEAPYARFVPIPLLGGVLFLRIVIADVVLSLPEILGGVLGVLLWNFLLY